MGRFRRSGSCWCSSWQWRCSCSHAFWALVRVLAELLGDYGPVSGPLIALGGLISFCGFGIFAVGLWSSLSRLPQRKP